jgi:hypothetical protein
VDVRLGQHSVFGTNAFGYVTDGLFARMPESCGMYCDVTVSQRWSSVMMMTTLGRVAAATVTGRIVNSTGSNSTSGTSRLMTVPLR